MDHGPSLCCFILVCIRRHIIKNIKKWRTGKPRFSFLLKPRAKSSAEEDLDDATQGAVDIAERLVVAALQTGRSQHGEEALDVGQGDAAGLVDGGAGRADQEHLALDRVGNALAEHRVESCVAAEFGSLGAGAGGFDHVGEAHENAEVAATGHDVEAAVQLGETALGEVVACADVVEQVDHGVGGEAGVDGDTDGIVHGLCCCRCSALGHLEVDDRTSRIDGRELVVDAVEVADEADALAGELALEGAGGRRCRLSGVTSLHDHAVVDEGGVGGAGNHGHHADAGGLDAQGLLDEEAQQESFLDGLARSDEILGGLVHSVVLQRVGFEGFD